MFCVLTDEVAFVFSLMAQISGRLKARYREVKQRYGHTLK
ncbi:hypothetical protein NEIFLAOT_02051 [Neisseria flavescens NRL30031/H210]|uniref:Uncharacterized protein n=1 Tax=Neisseria flavescens NRL30031/H210 TaxID=546264 RepID=C0EQ10_NEIFL|nr:hypothetical protein NEIFLAOT_02051 [Neisseria flavescens NRL30031/H210]